jgi:hypothetical protein
MSLVWVTKANYLKEYQIEIEFNNKKKGVIDLKGHLDKKIFEPLKEIDNFRKFKLNSWTLEWENGADFSPEFLLEHLN